MPTTTTTTIEVTEEDIVALDTARFFLNEAATEATKKYEDPNTRLQAGVAAEHVGMLIAKAQATWPQGEEFWKTDS
jgi:hypothetical protein